MAANLKTGGFSMKRNTLLLGVLALTLTLSFVLAACGDLGGDDTVPATGVYTYISSDAMVNIGKSIQVSASVAPSDSSDAIVWSSSDVSKATVDPARGRETEVTGVAVGEVVITAKAGSKTDSITIDVVDLIDTWTNVRNSPFSSYINSIAWGDAAGGGKFVAGGDNGKMAHSADGVTWIAVGDSTFGDSSIAGIAWGGAAGGGKFVAASRERRYAGGYTNGKMAYSSDGVTWTAVSNSTFGDSPINSIAWGGTAGNEKFVAGGDNGKMAHSADGVTWTAVGDSTFGNSPIYSIAWGGAAGTEKFVVGGGNGKMAYSADGVTWTAVGDSTFSYNASISRIAWGGAAGGGKFVAGGAGSMAAYSADGVTWTAANNSISGCIAWGGAAGNEKFVAAGYNYIIYSPDGVAWLRSAIDFDINSIAWGGAAGNKRFVVGTTDGRIAYSNVK
jgi:hypothetical protein